MMPRELPDWLDAYLEFQKRSESPTLYKKWVAVSSIASALQRKVWLQWDVEIFPNLYIVLIGHSGVRKGTAMNPALQIVRELEIETSADSVTREALINSMRLINYSFRLPSTGEPVVHSSITIVAPELAVFLGHNNPELISALTDWFDCRDPWIYKTRGRGEERIEKTWVNLIGATTTDLLQRILPQDAIGGGLTSRIIFVYGDRRSRTTVFPQLTAKEFIIRAKLKKDLASILDLVGEVEMTQEYADLYSEWYIKSQEEPVIDDHKFEGYVTRRSLHLKKVSIVFSASRGGDMKLKEIDFKRAVELLEETEFWMPRIYSGYGMAYYATILPRIQTYIAKRKEVRYGELVKYFMRDLTQAELENIISTLTSTFPPFCKLDKRQGDNGQVQVWVVYAIEGTDKERMDEIY